MLFNEEKNIEGEKKHKWYKGNFNHSTAKRNNIVKNKQKNNVPFKFTNNPMNDQEYKEILTRNFYPPIFCVKTKSIIIA